MKSFLCFILLSFAILAASAQEPIVITFNRPSKFTGSAAKIQITLPGAEISLKNGSSLSVNVTPVTSGSMKIQCKAGMNRAEFSLYPIPGEKYEFEVGFKMSGIYIELLSGNQNSFSGSTTKPGSEAAGWDTKLKVDRQNLGASFSATQEDQSEAIRQEWLNKGGQITSTSHSLTGMYFRVDLKENGVVDGYGGGYSNGVNVFKLKIPEYKTGLTTWNSFNWGSTNDILVYFFNYGIDEPPLSMKFDIMTMNAYFGLHLGWTLGIGKFFGEANWKGVALQVKYRPALLMSMVSTTVTMTSTSPFIPSSTTYNSDISFSFNPGGIGFDIQFSNFYATMNKLAPKAQSKISFFILPPVKDNSLFIAIGYGLTFYTK